MKGRIKINTELCKGCSYCVDACPINILKMSENTNQHSYKYAEMTDMDKCTGCKACAIMCPEIAIEVWVVEE